MFSDRMIEKSFSPGVNFYTTCLAPNKLHESNIMHEKKVGSDSIENIDNDQFVSDWFYHKYCRLCYDCGFTNIFIDKNFKVYYIKVG